MREMLLLVLLLSVTCAVAAPSPSGRYADAVLDAMRGMVAQLDTYSRLAEMAAPSVARTGELWLAGDRGFVLEGLNRAGGLMLVKEMKEPPAPAPVNITAAIPTLPVILCGAFTPDAAGSELESDQAEVPKQLFMGRMVLPVTPRGIWPGERGVDIGDMHSVDGLSLGAPVVTAHLWTFTAELISALTRLGKLPPMYQSMVVPGGRERNAEHLKLQYCRRTDQVGCYQQHTPTLLFQSKGKLGGGSGLSRTLQPHHENHRCGIRAFECKALISLVAEELNHLIVDDLDELLSGIDGLQNLFTGSLFHRAVYESPDDTKIYIGLKQGDLYLFDGILYVFLGNLRFAGERSSNPSKLCAY